MVCVVVLVIMRQTALSQSARIDKTLTKFVLRIDVVARQSIWGWQHDRLNDFLKITVAIPALVATTRRILENGLRVPFRDTPLMFTTYESNVPYALRFMVDTNICGGGWVELPKSTWMVRSGPKQSHCQLEVDTDWRTVIGHEANGEWIKMAPIRILSFDIECAGRKGHFPKPEIDPVIQIAR